MNDTTRAVALGAGLTVLTLAVMTVPVVVLADGLPAWLPTLGRSEVASDVYVRLVTASGFAGALALSVWAGRRAARDDRRVDPRPLGGFALGGIAVLTLAALLLAVSAQTGSPVFVLVTAITVLVSSVLPLAVGFLCGTTIARLSGTDDRSGEPLPERRPLWVPAWAGIAAATPVALDAAARITGATTRPPPTWAPQLGTGAETIAAYSTGLTAVGGLLLVGLALACGRAAGRRYDLTDDLRPFFALVAGGSGFAVTVVWLAAAWLGDSTDPVAVALASLLVTYASTALVATLAAVAGVGVAEFERATGVDPPGTDPDGSTRL